jgi:ABC-type amino acid transport substrate-binding protein
MARINAPAACRTTGAVAERRGAMRRLAIAIALLSLARPATSLDLAEMRQRGKLVAIVAGDPAAPSRFLARQGDAFVGIEGEILAGFARQQKLEMELLYVPSWEMLVPSLLGKKGDLIAGGMNDTPERRKLIAYTVETFPTRDVVVTRKPHRVVETVEQLREEQVGVAVGTSYVAAAKAAGVPQKNIKILDANASTTDLMRSGAITATVQGVEFALAPQEDDPSLQIGMFVGPPQSIAIGVRKEDQELLAALNEYIGNVRKSSTWNRLVIKYFGDRAIDVLRRARGE